MKKKRDYFRLRRQTAPKPARTPSIPNGLSGTELSAKLSTKTGSAAPIPVKSVMNKRMNRIL